MNLINCINGYLGIYRPIIDIAIGLATLALLATYTYKTAKMLRTNLDQYKEMLDQNLGETAPIYEFIYLNDRRFSFENKGAQVINLKAEQITSSHSPIVYSEPLQGQKKQMILQFSKELVLGQPIEFRFTYRDGRNRARYEKWQFEFVRKGDAIMTRTERIEIGLTGDNSNV